MSSIHRREHYDALGQLLFDTSPPEWEELNAVCVFHDGAMRTFSYFRSCSIDNWKHYDSGSFELMDWFEAFHKECLISENNDRKVAKVSIKKPMHMKIKLDHEITETLLRDNALDLIEEI